MITGDIDYNDNTEAEYVLSQLFSKLAGSYDRLLAIGGGAKGAETAGRLFANKGGGLPFLEFLPDPDTYGKKAEEANYSRIIRYLKNKIDKGDAVFAIIFWDEHDHRTRSILRTLHKNGIKSFVWNYIKDVQVQNWHELCV
jgi:hypothetical protein